MPAYAVDLLEAELGSLSGARVVILGVAYRGDVKETAFSGAFALRDVLAARGAEPLAADPLYDDAELRALGFEPWDGARRRERSCRPTTPATRPWAPTTCPACARSSTGAGCSDGARFAAAGVALRRIGGG